MVYRILAAIILAGGVMSAETPAVTTETSFVSTTTVTVKEGVNYKSQLDQQAKEIAQLKTARTDLERSNKELSVKLEALSKTNAELLSALKKKDAESELSNKKLVSLEKDLESLKAKLVLLDDLSAELSRKVDTDALSLSTLKVTSDSFKVKLDIAQDDIKVRSDELRALKDTISINKGNIDSVISDNIDIKRQLGEINAKSSSKKEEGILGWEYWGVVASGIGVLALILAIAK